MEGTKEAARLRALRRIAKAERRIARGQDTRQESGGSVSERAIAARLRRLLEEQS